MKKIFRTLVLGGMMAAAMGVAAQNTTSGYFLDNYNYRYQMNPAFGNERNFVSMPGLGNLNVAMRGNLHLSSVIYNLDGKTVLFTNPGIGVDEVMKKFKDKNRIGSDIKVNILSGGWTAWGGYNTVSINARADVGAIVPKSFFSLAKEGISNRTYDIKDLTATAKGYAELAFGHSRDIKQVPGLRAGAAVKFLIGIAAIDARFNEAHLTLGENEWIAETNADIYANIGGFQYEHKLNKKNEQYVSGANFDGDGSVGPNGFGMAFDLGATYDWRDFKFSAAALDLGWISYSKTKFASTNGTRTVNTDAYTFNADDDADNSFSKEWKNLRNNLEDLYQLTDNGEIGCRTYGLAATLNFGVDYTLPYYRKLHFGLLSSTRIQGRYSWSEVRVSANVNPVKCFSADANVAFGSYGTSFGWLLNYYGTGFSIFMGMDHTLGKLAKQGVPLSSNASVNFGINFPF